VALTKSKVKRPFQTGIYATNAFDAQEKDPYHRALTKMIYSHHHRIAEERCIGKITAPFDRVRALLRRPVSSAERRSFPKTVPDISQPGDFTIGVFSRLEYQKGQHLVLML